MSKEHCNEKREDEKVAKHKYSSGTTIRKNKTRKNRSQDFRKNFGVYNSGELFLRSYQANTGSLEIIRETNELHNYSLV